MKIINSKFFIACLALLGGVYGYYTVLEKPFPLAFNNSLAQQPAIPSSQAFSPQKLVDDARGQIGVTVSYDPAYTNLSYPNGDVEQSKGVCTDVVIRAMRQQGLDLQKLVHEDMTKAFSKYPTRWGLKTTDSNIDHRRVLNLEVFMQRMNKSLTVSNNPKDYRAGDWVTWRVGDTKLPHIGIVSDRQAWNGTPLIVHNIGAGTKEENVLFAFPITGHYRW